MVVMRIKIQTYYRTIGWGDYKLYIGKDGAYEIQTEHIESVCKLKDYEYFESIKIPVTRRGFFGKTYEDTEHQALELGVIDFWKVTMTSGAVYFVQENPFED